MGNFEETKFLGLTPRTIGLGVVAVGVVIGLFFIPETVKLLFDPKPKASSEKVVVASKVEPQKPRQVKNEEPKAAVAPDALNALNSNLRRGPKDKSASDKQVVSGKTARVKGDVEDKGDKGLFSGWNFQVKANPNSGDTTQIPSVLSFDSIMTKEGATFFKRGRPLITRFVQREGFSGTPAQDAVQPLLTEVDGVISGASKSVPAEELSMRFRTAHLEAIKGLRAAGADRGVLLRWLELPVVRFVDERSEVRAARLIWNKFSPRVQLAGLSIQEGRQGSLVGGVRPNSSYRAEFEVHGSDVDRLMVYSNGRLVRTIRIPQSRASGPRPVRIQGNAYESLMVVAQDAFGARPFAKNYAFYPRVQVFRQSLNGTYEIGFLPGSARNSLDRFFFVGGTGRAQNRDPLISTF
jgi:hypothetical protein